MIEFTLYKQFLMVAFIFFQQGTEKNNRTWKFKIEQQKMQPYRV